ncbi:MAG: ATP synthase F1 subunit epsilon [Bdellovibrionota bacterium]
MSALKLSILSPERRLLESFVVEELTLPTSEGQIQILPGHANMIGTIDTGLFHYQGAGGNESTGAFSSGFFEVQGDSVTVMAETIELKTEIDVDRAKRAQKIAEDALKDANLDESQFKKYQLKLQRSLIRQQLAGKEFGA